ncbi:hypothetical protein VZT92_026148 [Zoarces viviparus]|uniref:Uncharacterized protein n=1 Tax=Zoarces viviparus TaxID=48416 RepID=A0AAW1DZS4_ZOAVI
MMFSFFRRALTNHLLIGPNLTSSFADQSKRHYLVGTLGKEKENSTVHNLQERNISNRSTAVLIGEQKEKLVFIHKTCSGFYSALIIKMV